MNKIKLFSVMLVTLFITVQSYAQFHKGGCIIDYKLNTHTCAVSINNVEAKNLQKKWNETILKLQKSLSSLNTSNKKFEIRNDTLQVARKITVKKVAQYNIYKFPLNKLVNVTTSFNELIIYTKWKEIVVERYGYKKLQTSQITILKPFKKESNKELLQLFNKIKAYNTFREKINKKQE